MIFNLQEILPRLNNNEELLKKLSRTFLDTIDGDLSKLDEAVKAKDWIQAGQLAHKIKPSVGILCGPEVLDKLKALEEQFQSGSAADAQYQDMIQTLDKLKEEMNAYLGS